AVFINGLSQPGSAPDTPLIELDGSLMSVDAIGLEFLAGGNSVKGLIINNFGLSGIVLSELGNANPTGGSTIANNFIGTDATGTLAKGNRAAGIDVLSSSHNQIHDNLISGNLNSGIFVQDMLSSDNHINANRIGTDITGLKPLGNGFNGIAIGSP